MKIVATFTDYDSYGVDVLFFDNEKDFIDYMMNETQNVIKAMSFDPRQSDDFEDAHASDIEELTAFVKSLSKEETHSLRYYFDGDCRDYYVSARLEQVKPTEQEIKDCIAYFKDKDIHAYENNGKVYVNFDLEDQCVEISSDEIIERADIFNCENE